MRGRDVGRGSETSAHRVRGLWVGIVGTMLAFAAFLLVAEGLCRVFLPDRQLRYVFDADVLFRFREGQSGVVSLADGRPSPEIEINELGFRGPTRQGRSGRTILVLGDSFTFGSGVADHETFAARLDRALAPAVSVVNGGQPGYGVFQMAATLRRVAPVLRPSLVVIVLWQGDLLRQPPSEAQTAQLGQRFRLLQMVKSSTLATQVYRRIERLLLQTGSERLVFRLGGEGTRPAGGNEAAVIDAHLQGLEADTPRLLEMHEAARTYGHGIYLVLWPKEGFASRAEPGLAERLTTAVRSLELTRGVPVTTVQPALRAYSPAALLLPNDGHPTPLAHCLVARALMNDLQRFGYRAPTEIECPDARQPVSAMR
jgi:GDSL-like lipase/acylhydrolase family protein